MSFNGSGTFVINSAGQPVVANTVISATVFNALTADLATGLTNCITKDGQSTPTANIPMGNNKITGLGAGTAATDAATLGQVQSTAAKLITVTGTDTISGTMSPALTAYAAGQLFYFIANAANTGAMTINIDGLGAKNITRDGSTALVAGDVNSGEIVVICYDGTRFQMINAANSFGNTTINGTLTVTGNTALQANVSVTSALSVGGVFAVTGAATLGSTLAVTGKSDLPTVSTASINAAVAVVTTGTVTNLTATSASVASMNAGVALLTTATVTTLNATGASIASANIGNLQFTAASIASINAGVAVVTNLTATSASIASMNGSVASITTVNATTVDATNVEVTNVKAKDGTAAITIADSTGAVTVGAGATIDGGAVFNETGADVDFRIESDTNANAFVLDGATGNVGIGVTTFGNRKLETGGTLPSSGGYSYAVLGAGTFPSGATTEANVFSSFPATQAASFTVPALTHFYAVQSTFGAGSTVTNQYGFNVTSSLTGATNNYGFYSNIASGTNRFNFYANGTADNYFAGNVGIGTTLPDSILEVSGDQPTYTVTSTNPLSTAAGTEKIADMDFVGQNNNLYRTTARIRARQDGTWSAATANFAPTALEFYTQDSTTSDAMTSARMTIDASGRVGIGGAAAASSKVNALGTYPSSGTVTSVFLADGTIPSASTGTASIFRSGPTTEAASFSLSTLNHYVATASAFGAGSTVGSQFGFVAGSALTGATNNYGFYSNIASGSGRYNFYAAGTADNYFAGNVGIGTVTPAALLNVYGSPSGSLNDQFRITSSTAAAKMALVGTGAGNNAGFEVSSSDLIFYTATANTERMRITSDGNVKIGGTADRATTEGTKQLVLFNGTAPVGTLTNGVSFYSASGEANVMDAAGNATLLSPHDSETNEWIFRSKHTPTGKVLKIDVEKMLRFINEHFDLDMVHEFTE